MADQAVSSVGNFLFVAVVARTATVAEFGAFSLAYALYAIALGAGRAVGGEILLLRGVQRPKDARAESERLLFLVVAIGAVAGLSLLGLGLILDDPLGEILSALGICLPVLLLQDAIRYCFFARGEPTRAVLNDSVWTVAQVAFFAAILWLDTDAGAAALVLGWTGGAAVAVILGLAQTRLMPRPSLHLARGHGDRSRARSFLADFGLSALALNAGLYVIAGVAGLAAAGAVRGAMLLFAPLSALVSGLRIVVLPALARTAADGIRALRTRAEELGIAHAVVAVLYSAVVLLLPDTVGEAILGDTWPAAEPLIVALAVMYSAWATGAPALAGLRALGGGRILVTVRTASATLYLGSILLGSALWDASGAAAGMAFAFSVEATLWWACLFRARQVVGQPISGHEELVRAPGDP